MPSNFGTTPLSTTALGTNQFPVSAAFVPGTAGGALTAVEGIASNTDANGYQSTAFRIGLKDGDDATQGLTTDTAVTGDIAGTLSAKLRGINKILAQLQFDGSNFLKVNVAAGSVTANIGTTNGLALDATVAKLNVAQGTALGSNTGPMLQGSVTTSAPSYTTGNINPLSLNTAGGLRVDGSGVTQPVSGTFWQATQPVSIASLPALPAHQSVNVDQIAGSTIATAASGIAKVGLTDGTGNAITSTSSALDVNIKSGGGSGFSVVDETAWTAGTSAFVPAGGVFNDSAAALTSGQEGAIRLTNNRAMHSNIRNASGTELATSSNPLRIDPTGITTQPISGTVTANAGTNLNTSALALDTSVNGLLLSQGSTTSGQKGPLAQGAVTTNAPSYTTAQTSSLSLDTSGLLRVSLKDTPANTNNLNVAINAALPTGGNIIGAVTQASGPWTVHGPVASGAANANNPVKTGGVFNTTQPTVTNGQIVDAQSTARGAAIVSTGVDIFNVTVNAALPTGANTIGAVTQASGPWTQNLTLVGGTNIVTGGASGLIAVGGPVASGASNADNPLKIGSVFNTTQPTVTNGQIVDVQATARGALIVASGVDALTVAQGGAPWAENITQFGNVALSTGTGASGTGIPRVTVANDSRMQLWDGANAPVAVKAAQTSPVLADLALVQAISPNNTGLPVNIAKSVQKAANKSTGSVASLALAFGSNNVAGNSIVVVCAVGNGTAPTISDTAGNTYIQAAQIANGTALNTAVFYSVGPAAGGGIAAGANTVTVNNGGTTASIAMEIYEVSGLITQVPAQPSQTAIATGNSGTAATSNIGAASPNEYAFAGIGIGTAAQTITAGTGWTNDSGQQNPTTPAGLFSFISMSQFLGSLKSVTPQATFTSEPWAIAIATFRPVVLGIEGTMSMGQSGLGTITSVVGAASSTQLLAANTNRKGAYFYNDSTAILYLALASSASVSAYTLQIPAQGFYEAPVYPVYTGAIFGIWASATGNARITEMT